MEMVANENRTAGSGYIAGAKGTPVFASSAIGARNGGMVGIPLAKHNVIEKWTPKISDFVIYHGLFRRWYGIISAIDHVNSNLHIIIENTPMLLLTMPDGDYPRNTKIIPIKKIRDAIKGGWSILQGDIWYL